MVAAYAYRVASTQTFFTLGGAGTTVNNSSLAHGYANSATGNQSLAMGYQSTASGQQAFAAGYSCTASGSGTLAHGSGSQAVGDWSQAEGYQCSASASLSHAAGYKAFATRRGQYALGAGSMTAGTTSATAMAFAAETTDATPKIMTSDNLVVTATGTSPNVLTVPVNRAHTFRLIVVARHHDNAGNPNGDAAGWIFTGLIYRGFTGPLTLAAGLKADTWYSAGSGPWDVTLAAESGTTPGYLRINVTGVAAKTIQWVGRLDAAEVG